MNREEELLYQIALTFVAQVGDVTAKNLIAYCGNAKNVFSTSSARLLKIPEVGMVTAQAIRNKQVLFKAEAELEFTKKNNIQCLFYTDEAYPTRLKECSDAPAMLYCKGNANLNASKALSIVGTRNATVYGKNFIHTLCKELSQYKITILSGMAYGIDTYAHKYACEFQMPNIAVLGHGLHTIYPSQNTHLAKLVMQNGACISEFTSQHEMNPANFPKRNRIVAGMSDALLVVESAIKGGALITANIAHSYHRDVFALPGKIDAKYSAGCNLLIKENKAALVENANDIIKLMGWDEKKIYKPKQQLLLFDLNDDEKNICTMIQKLDIAEIDILCKQLQMSSGKMASILLDLELKGVIQTLPGKRYKLL